MADNGTNSGLLTVRLVTPDRLLVDATAQAVELPSMSGYLEALYGAAPLLAELGAGEVRLHGGSSGDQKFFVAWGFVEVLPERVTILAETALRPKPMVEIGGQPILWHIMKHYAHYGFTEFVCALGYKGEFIKRFFLDYALLSSGFTMDFATGDVQRHNKEIENWVVHLVDTGTQTLTGGRLKRLEPWLKDEPFMLTYGDGVCDIDLQELLRKVTEPIKGTQYFLPLGGQDAVGV